MTSMNAPVYCLETVSRPQPWEEVMQGEPGRIHDLMNRDECMVKPKWLEFVAQSIRRELHRKMF